MNGVGLPWKGFWLAPVSEPRTNLRSLEDSCSFACALQRRANVNWSTYSEWNDAFGFSVTTLAESRWRCLLPKLII
jgi:hypothetical protein